MEDRFHNTSNNLGYEEEIESEDDAPILSSDEEKDNFDYFLTTEAGKDILKQKGSQTGAGGSNIDRIVLSNTVLKEELFYDDDIDKQNQEWMDRKRQKQTTSNSNKKATKSDALLSCPGCMVTVCIDCQRHDIYKTQFRAMFVMNCYIVTDEILKYETKNKSKKRRKKEGPGKLIPVDKESDDMSNSELEVYNPVKCGSCDTELAVYDKSEIYHFHNVLESLS